MSHVFISYKREDELRVARIAQGLQAEGLDVWWDRGLPGGESWRTNIETKLQEAGCVLLVWSLHSAGEKGSFVREEARRGLARNILVPVLIDPVPELPLEFDEVQALDLTIWRGDRGATQFQDLVRTVRAKLAGAAVPRPSAPTKRLTRKLMWGSVSSAALAAVAAVASFSFDTFGLATAMCTMPGAQPALSDGCGFLGLGGRPNRAERLAWEGRAPGSCPALREYIERFPNGAFRSQAAALLTARKVSVFETGQPAIRTLSMFEPIASPAKDESTAQARALERGKENAERLCRGFVSGTMFKYVSATPIADKWSCSTAGQGVVCGFEGHAQCNLTERHASEEEHCG